MAIAEKTYFGKPMCGCFYFHKELDRNSKLGPGEFRCAAVDHRSASQSNLLYNPPPGKPGTLHKIKQSLPSFARVFARGELVKLL